MPRPYTATQRNFTGGEISATLYGRYDVERFAASLNQCRNMIPTPYGPAVNRPGFAFVAEAGDGASAVRLTRFMFNRNQAYIIEWGDQYIRLHQDGAPYTVTGSAYAGGTTYDEGDIVTDGGITYRSLQGSNTGNTPASSGAWWQSLGADGVLEIPTSYTAAQLFDIQTAQSADILTICHPSHAIAELRRYSADRWVLSNASVNPFDGTSLTFVGATGGGSGSESYLYVIEGLIRGDSTTYQDTLALNNINTPTSTNSVVLEWNPLSDAYAYRIYRQVTAPSGSKTELRLIGITAGTTNGSGNLEWIDDGTTDFGTAPSASQDIMGSSNNYPSTVAYVQQRLAFANSNNDPYRFWMSNIGQYLNFYVHFPSQDDDAIIADLADGEVNEIHHILALDKLLVMTSGSVHQMLGDQDGVIRPGAINLRLVSNLGVDPVSPVKIDNSAVYAQAGGKRVRDLLNTGQGFKGSDLTLYARHLFEAYTVTEMEFQDEPYGVVWIVRSDGSLLSLTYQPDQQVGGWAPHSTDGTFESISVIPESNRDRLYAVVKRTINGSEKRYIERLDVRDTADMPVDAYFVDSRLSFDGRNTSAQTLTLSGGSTWAYPEEVTLTASTSEFVSGDVGNHYAIRSGADSTRVEITAYTSGTVVTVRILETVPASLQGVATTDWDRAVDSLTGLTHLEGETVAVLGDGTDLGTYTVASGVVTLDEPVAVAHVGLPFTSTLKTHPIELLDSTILTKAKRISEASIQVADSVGFKVGIDTSNLMDSYLKWRTTEDLGSPTALRTDSFRLALPARWEQDGTLTVQQTRPLPLTVLSVSVHAEIGN